MMATKDEALLMAIEFMETLTIDVGIKTWNEKHRKETIQTCKEALEQPAQETAYQVGEIVNPYGSNIKIKQPAQEPLPMVRHKNDNFSPASSWQGLSDDEIDSAWSGVTKYGISGVDFTTRFARAIEQALRNKNGY